MAYKIKINGINYTLKVGFTIKDELNETLDSGLVSFITYGSEVDAESFDAAEIAGDRITDKNMLVDSYDDKIYSMGADFLRADHTYTMTLFSETKELERITLPNCSVTQPLTGTKKTVYEVILKFCNLYLPKIRVGTSANNYSFENKFFISEQTLSAKFSGIECPEFQWNRPTLREVLNDLMSTANCIVIVKNQYIDFLDLTAYGDQIDTTKLTYSKRTMNSADYVGELSIDMQNAIGKRPTQCCQYITLKAPEGTANITTENAICKTQYPIYEINSVRVYVRFKSNNSYYYEMMDITGFIKEFEEWNLLSGIKIYRFEGSAWYNLPEEQIGNVTVKKHKSNYLYFTRGKSTIENFAKLWDAFGPDAAFFKDVVLEYMRTLNNGSLVGVNEDPREALLYVTYNTVGESSINAGKYLPFKHSQNRIIDNQANSYIDMQHQSVFEYAKVNRLGNKIREVGGNYSSDAQVPQLGDRIGNEILFSREICYLDSMVQFKGFLAPNYILKDFFTGVRAKKRSWQIANESDALSRRDTYKLYFEATLSNGHPENFNYDDGFIRELDGIGRAVSVQLISAFKPEYNISNRIRHALLNTEDANGIVHPVNDGNKAVAIECDAEAEGMSLCFNFGYNDNLKSAEYTQKETASNEIGFSQNFYAYADENGEFEKHNIYLIPSFDGFDMGLDTLPFRYYTHMNQSQADQLLKECLERPLVGIETACADNDGIRMTVRTNKDNREIIKHTIQFEYCSDTENIILTPKIVELCELCTTKTYAERESNLRIHYSTDGEIELHQTKDNSPYVQLTASNVGITVGESASIAHLSVSLPNNINLRSWSITDSDNNIIIGVNSNQRYVNFSLLRTRDRNVYRPNDRKTVVAKI